jgi:twitching motility protein PilT
MMVAHPILSILRDARALGASDVHIAPRDVVAVRLHGSIERPWPGRTVDPAHIASFVAADDGYTRRTGLTEAGAIDGSLVVQADGDVGAIGAVRVHATTTVSGTALALRLLAPSVADLASLGLPAAIGLLAERRAGLVLFVGPAGSGKTTAMASLGQAIVREQRKHLVAIGDPIEYHLQSGAGIVSEMEVGGTGQADSYAAAMRSAARMDPDVLLVSESRDAETMAAAIDAAEYGRLCLTSVHARDASSVFERIVRSFAPHAQSQIRVSLANAVAAVVVLRLLPRSDQPGRVAACEVLVATDAVRALIRDDQGSSIRNVIATSGLAGMHTLEADISRLVFGLGIVDERVGKAASVRPDEVRSGSFTPGRSAPSATARRSLFEGA